MSGRIECRYHGRDFTAGEMALRRARLAGPPPLDRHALPREFCKQEVTGSNPVGSIKVRGFAGWDSRNLFPPIGLRNGLSAGP